jgi:hypothetical protein
LSRLEPAESLPHYYFSHSIDVGCVFSHRIESDTPPANCAHAAVVALRCASCRLAADAVRQSDAPLKLIHTRHRYACPCSDEYATAPITSTAKRIPIQTVGFTSLW